MRMSAVGVVAVFAGVLGAGDALAAVDSSYLRTIANNNIRTFRNGETEVTVSNACTATYDARGYRINNGRCSGDDITRADQQYAGYRGQGGGNGAYGNNPGYGDNRFGRAPDNIRTFQNGETEVTVSSACVAIYDQRGYRINNGRCSGDDITRADQQYADYRTYFANNNRGNGGFRGNGRTPENMRTYRNGETEIVMSNNCVITYDPSGYRVRSDRGCSGGDITRADQEYASYRRP